MRVRIITLLPLVLFLGCARPGPGGDGGTGDGSESDGFFNDALDGYDASDSDESHELEDAGGDRADFSDASDTDGSGGSDGDGSPDACAGLSACDCLKAILDHPDRCLPERLSEIEQRALSIIEAIKAPCVFSGQAVFLYYGEAATVEVAGEFNNWMPEPMERVCTSKLWIHGVKLNPARYEYKLVVDGTWRMDPANRAFAYDDYAANPDRKNSVVNFPESGQSHLEWWPGIISNELGNGRDIFVYVPAGYRQEEVRLYPVLYMHDGQNIFDDATCCFGHGGWQVNLTADKEIAAGRVSPFFVIGIANTEQRPDEYTPCVDYSRPEPFGGKAEAYERFVLETVIPMMESAYRIDPQARALAGSSMGGNISMFIGLRHPELFRNGLGSLSGAFWVCQEAHQAVRDQVSALSGRLDLPIYLDSGGDPQTNEDGAADTLEVRQLLQSKGFTVFDAQLDQPCDENFDVCYHLEPGALHNESAWRERVWRMIRFLM